MSKHLKKTKKKHYICVAIVFRFEIFIYNFATHVDATSIMIIVGVSDEITRYIKKKPFLNQEER